MQDVAPSVLESSADDPVVEGTPAFPWVRTDTLVLVGLVLLALVSRGYQLGKNSLWVDEIRVALRPDGLSFFDSVRRSFGPLDPPLSYAAVSISRHLPLGLDAAARVPAMLAGGVEVAFAFLVMRRLAQRRLEAVSAGVLLAVAPFAIRWAQEAHYYTLFSALHVMSWWALLRVIDRRKYAFTVWSLVMVFAVYTNVFAWLAFAVEIGVLAGVLVVRARRDHERVRSDVWRAAGAVGAVVVAFVPWAVYEAMYWATGEGRGRTIAFNRDEFPVRFDPQYLVDSARWLFGNGSGLLTLAAVLVAIVAFTGRRWRVAAAMSAYVLFVLAAAVLLSRLMTTYVAFRRFEFLVPVCVGVVALGVGALRDDVDRFSRHARILAPATAVVVCVALVALSLRADRQHYRTEKTAYRSVATAVRNAPAADVVVLGTFSTAGNAPWPPSIRAYLRAQGVTRPIRAIDDLAALPPSGNVLWITGAPAPDGRFTTQALNRPDRLQFLVGDRSLQTFTIPVYVLRSSYDSPAEFAAQARAVAALGFQAAPG